MTTSPTTFEPIYVVDTNVLICYLTNQRKLSQQAAAIFEEAERGETRLFISAIVLAELYYADKKWKFFEDFTVVYRNVISQPYFRVVPFEARDVLDFDEDITVSEMHDRIIVGLARRLEAPLLTSDPNIIESGLVAIAW